MSVDVELSDIELSLLKFVTREGEIHTWTIWPPYAAKSLVSRGLLEEVFWTEYMTWWKLTDAGRAVVRQLGIEKGGGR